MYRIYIVFMWQLLVNNFHTNEQGVIIYVFGLVDSLLNNIYCKHIQVAQKNRSWIDGRSCQMSVHQATKIFFNLQESLYSDWKRTILWVWQCIIECRINDSSFLCIYLSIGEILFTGLFSLRQIFARLHLQNFSPRLKFALTSYF